MLGAVALGLAVLLAEGAAYVAVAWHLARRLGLRVLHAAWLCGTLLLWATTLLRLPPGEPLMRLGFLSLTVCAVGLATLSVRRRLRASPHGRLTAAAVAAGAGAFLLGLLLGATPVLVSDILTVARG